MPAAPTLDQPVADALAAAVQMAYQAAVGAGWSAGARQTLWDAAVEAVTTYLAEAPRDPAARRYHHLLLDLAADAPAEAIADWPAPVQRAARLAATHALRSPSKPHHRPRAQALLKRLDLVQSPLLQARERLLIAVTRARQALTVQRHTGPLSLRPAAQAAETANMLLGRITEAARAMPLPDPDGDEAGTAIVRLNELRGLVESGAYAEPARHGALFEAIQRLAAPGRPLPALGPAQTVLETIRLHANPAVRAGRQALTAIVFELDLAALDLAEGAALARHLADLEHVARNLGDIPAAQLGPILFRLRQRLADPLGADLDRHVEDALAVLARLHARRDAAMEEEGEDAARRVRERDQLADAVHAARLAKLSPAEVAGLQRTYAQVEALAGEHGFDGAAFSQALLDVARQLERPALGANRLWQLGRVALRQLLDQRRGLEEQARGLALDRHLDAAQREARHADLSRRAAALDQARVVLGSLPLERIHPAAEADALAALQGFSAATRLAATAGEVAPLRSALDLLVLIGGRLA